MLLNRKLLLSAATLASLAWALSAYGIETLVKPGDELDEEQPVLLLEPEPALEEDKAEAKDATSDPTPDINQEKIKEVKKPARAEAEEPTVAETADPEPKATKKKQPKVKHDEAVEAIDAARTEKKIRRKAEPDIDIAIATEGPAERASFEILGASVPPGAIRHLGWRTRAGFGVLDQPTPVLVVHGKQEGPVLCLTAAVHGDEINGIDVVRRVIHGLDAETLKGTVVGVPIVNLPGFQRGSRYLPDRRDLNRHFPGDPKGSLASRIAHSFFEQIILAGCHLLVDVHTGSFHRTNLPQLRADLRDQTIADMVHGFGDIAVLQSVGARGTLRRAAAQAGVPSVTVETGEPLRLQPSEVARGVKGVEALMSHLGMARERRLWKHPQPIYYESRWQRVQRGGILFSKVKLGDSVRIGDVLGTVTDPITNKGVNLIASYNGRILGRALNQFVMPGFAAFHIGIQSSQEELISETEAKALEEVNGGASSEVEDESRPDRLAD